jgi:hypothetical protein
VHCELRRHSRCRLGPCSTPGRAVVDKYAFTSEHSITMTRNVADGLEVHRPPPEGSHRSGAALRAPAAPTPRSGHRRPTTLSRPAKVITRQMMSYLTIKGSTLLTLSKLERVLLRAQGGWTEAMDMPTLRVQDAIYKGLTGAVYRKAAMCMRCSGAGRRSWMSCSRGCLTTSSRTPHRSLIAGDLSKAFFCAAGHQLMRTGGFTDIPPVFFPSTPFWRTPFGGGCANGKHHTDGGP